MEDTQGKIFQFRTDSAVIVLIATMIFGGVVMIFGYIVSRYSRSHGAMDSTKGGATVPEQGKRVDTRNPLTGSTTNNSSVNKRTKNKKRRETQQEFTHSWVVGTLKGHTSTIFNMSFSSNGKLLASCAEDGKRPNQVVVQEGTGETSSKTFYHQQNKTLVGCPPPPVAIKDDWQSLNLRHSPVNLNNHHHHHHHHHHLLHHHHHFHQNIRTKSESELAGENNVERRPTVVESNLMIVRCNDIKSSGQRQQQQQQQQVLHMQEWQTNDRMFQHSSISRQRSSNAMSQPDICYPWPLPQYQLHAMIQQHQQQQQQLRQRQLQAQMHAQMQQQHVQNQLQFFEEMNKDDKKGGEVKTTTTTTTTNNANASLKKNDNACPPPNYNENFCIDRVPATATFTNRYMFNINDVTLEYLLRIYTHHTYYLIEAGYPFTWNFDFRIKRYIFNLHQSKSNGRRQLDVNAKEFVPNGVQCRIENGDSSGNSSNSSDMELENQIDDEKHPRDFIRSASFTTNRKPFIVNLENIKRQRSNSISNLGECSSIETRCSRCLRSFYMYQTNTGDNNIFHENCVYHSGELSFQRNSKCKIWSCCKERTSTLGCTSNQNHDWIGLKKNYNGPYVDFVRTIPTKKIPINGTYGVYGVDCEMVITTSGFELAKITMIDVYGVVVYDEFVKPTNEIVDYNTAYSGITPENLSDVTKTLKDVQKDLMGFVNAETILIGHGLENDLRALHMLHFTVIDTALLLRHKYNLPYRYSLKKLTKSLLMKDIQVSSHNSIEDARCAIDLVFWKLKSDGF